jgi:hypothetical protein
VLQKVSAISFDFQIPAASKRFQETIGSYLMSFQAMLVIHWYKSLITACKLKKIMEDLKCRWLRTADVVLRV